ncbi:hypothetical protein ABPG72_001548 [Tetrahymena utriculariae]
MRKSVNNIREESSKHINLKGLHLTLDYNRILDDAVSQLQMDVQIFYIFNYKAELVMIVLSIFEQGFLQAKISILHLYQWHNILGKYILKYIREAFSNCTNLNSLELYLSQSGVSGD